MGLQNSIKVRAAIVFRHISQSTTSCLIAMTKGNLDSLTLHHWKIALLTGIGSGLISLLASLGDLVRFQTSRWGVAVIALVGTTIADYLNHSTIKEALLTGLGAALLSCLISLTPVDKLIKELQQNDGDTVD
ncbi:hypothetical protein [Legionella jordanis]|uniref:Holin n=1 Tax=Legionella jordanis TaxID=456 RepID=A0A0W0VB48_9GAMM|nr:hypothetical protein [Legionella jordanis]KTD17328.1 hypothetical protein Ljor_1634 [Legionella jordanis]RMX01904.1 hypothetical protein EAW55_10400 [Legionella jordanis]RMX17694.1 hypothetical protein EAS68_10415 [Legionella jordanis]VEH11655.1 Uncharacterised protein [Legionella jordanis]HAT8712967.1 hypothetical protein [Legionella jordanis]